MQSANNLRNPSEGEGRQPPTGPKPEEAGEDTCWTWWPLEERNSKEIKPTLPVLSKSLLPDVYFTLISTNCAGDTSLATGQATRDVPSKDPGRPAARMEVLSPRRMERIKFTPRQIISFVFYK